MSRLKPWFLIPYVGCHIILACIAGWLLIGGQWAWSGILIEAIAPLLLIASLYFRSRTSENLPIVLSLVVLGMIVTIVLPLLVERQMDWGAAVVAVFSLLLTCLYIFWYSKIDVASDSRLVVGQRLPTFSVLNERGRSVSSQSFIQGPAVTLFFRGNWCPLCMSQIRDMAARYETLAARGISIHLISPQSQRSTQVLAKRFDVPLQFFLDERNKAAIALGIYQKHAVPKGMFGYDEDAPAPTVIITDAEQNILFTDTSLNYRVRPNPELFLKHFDEAGTNWRR